MSKGVRRNIGRINILELEGSYKDMGLQYGAIFKDRFEEFYRKAIDEYFIKKAGMPYLKLLAMARFLFRSYPGKIKDMFSGMSESSGVGINKLIMLDQVNTFELMRNQDIGRCSNIALWGDYTEDGSLIFGRNFDEPEYFKNFNDFIILLALFPEDGVPFFNISHIGQMGVNYAMNKNGVFLTNNEAPVLKKDVIDMRAPNILISELEFLARSANLKDIENMINNTRTNCPIIVTAGDRHSVSVYEWTVPEVKKGFTNGDGCIIATNHFTNDLWDRPAVENDSYGMTGIRRDNLTSLAIKNKGKFNMKKLRELLDINITDGGATHSDKTILQITVLPENMNISVKIPGFQDWIDIDLNLLFNPGSSSGDFKFSVKQV